MNASFDPLRLVNTYGAFGAVTRVRREIVLEGTDEDVPGPATVWKEYQFKAKPGDPRRRPRQVAPYHLRLDWLLWFAAMSPPPAHPWMTSLVTRLLEHDRPTLTLLGHNPFPDRPPCLRPGPPVPLPLHHRGRAPPDRRLVVPRPGRGVPAAAAPRPATMDLRDAGSPASTGMRERGVGRAEAALGR